MKLSPPFCTTFTQTHWQYLSANPHAIGLLKPEHIAWDEMSMNPNGIPLLESNLEMVNWKVVSLCCTSIDFMKRYLSRLHLPYLCANPYAIDIISTFHNLDWRALSKNSNALPLLMAHPDRICWDELSLNSNAIALLESSPDKINWSNLSKNPNAMHLLLAFPERIDWVKLSENPNAIPLLESNIHKICWFALARNTNGLQLCIQHVDKLHDNIYQNPMIFIP
jgi:hypothetical protein